MIVLEKLVTSYIVDNAPGRTDAVLMDRFGISYNTFRKIEARQPIRESLAGRIIDRIENEELSGNNARQR